MKQTTFDTALHYEPISTSGQAKRYIRAIVNAGMAWHWDDDPAEIVWNGPAAVAPEDFGAVRQRIAECRAQSWFPFECMFDFSLSCEATTAWQDIEESARRVLDDARRDFAVYYAENHHRHDGVDIVDWFTDDLPIVRDDEMAERFLEGLGERAEELRRWWWLEHGTEMDPPTCPQLAYYAIARELYATL